MGQHPPGRIGAQDRFDEDLSPRLSGRADGLRVRLEALTGITKKKILPRPFLFQCPPLEEFCNPPEAPIWMADLTFRPLGEVRVGDEVIGWQPINGRLRLVPAKVLNAPRKAGSLVRVTFASGRTLRCTPQHLWRSAFGGGDGNGDRREFFVRPEMGRTLCHVVEPTRPVSPALAREAAWLGGVFDGEGSVSPGGAIHIAQSVDANPEMRGEIERVLAMLGFDFSGEREAYVQLRGAERGATRKSNQGRQVLVDFVNVANPFRRPLFVSRGLRTANFTHDRIVGVEPDGEGDVYALTTTTGNYVAWGYASKNSVEYSHAHSDYETVTDGQYSRPGGVQLRTVSFDTLFVDWGAYTINYREDEEPPEVEWLTSRLVGLVESGSPFLLTAAHAFPSGGFQNWDLTEAGPEVQMPATLRTVRVAEKAGEGDARYVNVAFTEYRDPVVPRKGKGRKGGAGSPGGRAWPATVLLKVGGSAFDAATRGAVGPEGKPATWTRLAQHYYGPGASKELARYLAEENGMGNWGLNTPLIERPEFVASIQRWRRKKGDKKGPYLDLKLRVPPPPSAVDPTRPGDPYSTVR